MDCAGSLGLWAEYRRRNKNMVAKSVIWHAPLFDGTRLLLLQRLQESQDGSVRFYEIDPDSGENHLVCKHEWKPDGQSHGSWGRGKYWSALPSVQVVGLNKTNRCCGWVYGIRTCNAKGRSDLDNEIIDNGFAGLAGCHKTTASGFALKNGEIWAINTRMDQFLD